MAHFTNRLAGLTAALILVVMTPALLSAQENADDDREAFGDAANFPWYDLKKESIKSTVEPKSEPDRSHHRDSNWVYQTPKTSSASTNWPKWDWPSFDFGLLVNIFFWCFVSLIFVALIIFVIWALMRQGSPGRRRSELRLKEKTGTDAERIENLPFDMIKPGTDLLAAAQEAYRRGDYRQAIVYLYSHMLVQLDKYSWIHLAKGKTNRQYLMEVRRDRELVVPLERVMIAFEDVFFGDLDLKESEVEGCWNSLEDFQKRVAQRDESYP